MNQNPNLYSQLTQNPQLLQQMVGQQIMSMQQNYPNNQQQMNNMQNNQQQINNMQNNQPQMNMFQQNPQINMSPLNTQSQINMMQQPNTQSHINMYQQPAIQPQINHQNAAITDTTSIIAPTLQQMQYMFTMWEKMNQMGILKTDVPPKPILPQNDSNVSQTVGQEIILPNGDKIVPLGNKKYGLIKKV